MSNSVDKWLANIINLSDLPETDRLIFGKIRKRANQLIKEGKIGKAKNIIEMGVTKFPLDYYGYYTMVEPFTDGYYKVGEKAQISFPSSEGGRALISIENGSKVVETMWVKTTASETKVEIPITPATTKTLTPNSATATFPKASDTPIEVILT
jgi:hypothetical protein